MGRYLLRRLLLTAPLMLGVTILGYGLINLAPGDPVSMLVSPEVGSVSPEDLLERKRALGLDDPLPVRYVRWLGEAMQGNLGYSIANGRPVSERVSERLTGTLQLMLAALALSVVIGIPIGALAAVRRDSLPDRVSAAAAFLAASIPTFFVGLGLIYLLSLKLDLFPTGGMDTIGRPFSLGDRLQHLALPAFVLSLAHIAELIRYTRASLLDALEQDYVRTATAKGLSRLTVIGSHALRNALLPVITIVGLTIPQLLGGTLITETIFQWPGMGSLSIEAVRQRDYPVLMGVTLVSAISVLGVSLLTDIAYALVDPRIRFE
ncbi:MAG: ABC transporter permease [Chloroflexi bacterium]|nr:ABC transporter permease [Chloroflexota bacterium]